MNFDYIVREQSDFINLPEKSESVTRTKMVISKAIRARLNEKELSVRALAGLLGVKHPHVVRVTSGENYTIESLLKILEELDLEILIRAKE